MTFFSGCYGYNDCYIKDGYRLDLQLDSLRFDDGDGCDGSTSCNSMDAYAQQQCIDAEAPGKQYAIDTCNIASTNISAVALLERNLLDSINEEVNAPVSEEMCGVLYTTTTTTTTTTTSAPSSLRLPIQ